MTIPRTTLGKAGRRAARGLHARELLGVQGIPRSALDHRRAQLVVGRVTAEKRLDEPLRVVGGEWSERNGQRVPLAAAPVRPALEQLGPRAGDDEQRHVLDELDQRVHEVEQAVIGPLQVVDHEDERTLLGEGFEEEAPPSVQLGATITQRDVLRREPDQRAEARLDPAPLPLRDEVGDRLRELLRCDRGRVVLVDARTAP